MHFFCVCAVHSLTENPRLLKLVISPSFSYLESLKMITKVQEVMLVVGSSTCSPTLDGSKA